MKKGSLLATNITTSVPIQSDIHNKAKPCIVKTTMEIKCEPGYLGTSSTSVSSPLQPTPYSLSVLFHQLTQHIFVTLVMASEVALSLLHVPSLPPLAQHGGILTPATALGDVIVRRLTEAGYWEIGSTVVHA